MHLEHTQCCAVQEIVDLRTAVGAEDAMNRFLGRFKQRLFSHYDYSTNKWGQAIYKEESMNWDLIPAFIIFSEIVETHYESAEEERRTYGGSSGKFPTKYGEALTKLIQENNLGEVVESPIRRNRVNHPQHDVKIYIWTPDLDALKAYATEKGMPFTPILQENWDNQDPPDDDDNYSDNDYSDED